MTASAEGWPEAVVMCVFIVCVTAFSAYLLYLKSQSDPANTRPEVSSPRREHRHTTVPTTARKDER